MDEPFALLDIKVLAKSTQGEHVFLNEVKDVKLTLLVTFLSLSIIPLPIPPITWEFDFYSGEIFIPGGDFKLWLKNKVGSIPEALEFLFLEIKFTDSTKYSLPNDSITANIKNASKFRWVGDIVVDLIKVSPDKSSVTANHDYLGSFILKEDDSLELLTDSLKNPPLLKPLENTEHFMSGYREAERTGPDPVALMNRVMGVDIMIEVLTKSPGRYFIVNAQSISLSPTRIWSYCDNVSSLMFWPSANPYRAPTKYRVIPFSTLGMTDLKSDVAKGRLLDAVALPETLKSRLLDVSTGIDSTNSKIQVKIDFEQVPTSIYNWEVFFHIPLLVATQLSRAQRFEEAQRWFHLIFDPTTNDSETGSSRYWRFLPFRMAGKGQPIDELMQDLAQGKIPLEDKIMEWAENPFRPHLIARHRMRSYQFAVVQKYLENLISWGDQLFYRDTIEAINEATQMYVLAAKILGKRPVSSPSDNYVCPGKDAQGKYNGPSGIVKDIQGIQVHEGRNFFFPDGKMLNVNIDECPYLHISIKAEKGTKTCLFLMVQGKEPNEHKNRFVVIGKTPKGDPGIYDVIADPFTIEDDNQLHEYDFDLRNLGEKDDEYPFFPGSVSIIEFYSWTGSGKNTFHFNDLVFKPLTATTKKSYRDIQSSLDDFSNAWVPLEALIPTLSPARETSVENKQPISDLLNSLGSLYFCIPGNEKLSSYWDTVEDRLFKIRHCMNIGGVERQLPLFEPPIDPALLVKATAAGLDLAAVLSDLQAPLPLYRFNVMVQKALDLCSEVRALGNALLSALEKKDAEELSLLRSSHEIQMLKLVRAIKVQQKDEAETNLAALRKTREVAALRYLNYQRLLGKQNIVVPAEGTVAALETSALQMTPPSAGDTDAQGLALISAESDHMGWLDWGNKYSLIAGSNSVLAGIFHAIPDFVTGATVPVAAQTKFGGSNLGSATSAAGAAWGMLATNASYQAGRSATIGGYQRRYDEWRFQSNSAAKELEQIDKQIIANDIRRQIAEGEIVNHDQQIENSQEVDEFMRDKFTSQQLYSWMVGQISSVYFRTYQLAYNISKRAERTYRFELGLKDSNFIEYGYWDSLKKGLLSGERLYLDIKRMEVAYLDQNKREYEITKHVSLMQLDPVALLKLKEIGKCEVSLPEELFDLDFPGHYLRRIKSVSLTIPCITGPYSSVPCTLTLLKHSMRHSSSASGNYIRDIENDDSRFIDSFGAIQSIVTSSAQNDSGLFETNLRDERYLPFEGAGVISTWRIELPSEFRQFNYDTISDVILHLRFTAHEGGERLKTGAVKNIESLVKIAEAAGSVRLFSVRHEFPTEWAKFKNATVDLSAEPNVFAGLTLNLQPEHYPFWSKGRLGAVKSAELYVKTSKSSVEVEVTENIDGKGKKDTLSARLRNLVTGPLTNNQPLLPTGKLTLYFNDKSMEDLWLVLAWGK